MPKLSLAYPKRSVWPLMLNASTGKRAVGRLRGDIRTAMNSLALGSVHAIDALTKTPLASASGQLIDTENMWWTNGKVQEKLITVMREISLLQFSWLTFSWACQFMAIICDLSTVCEITCILFSFGLIVAGYRFLDVSVIWCICETWQCIDMSIYRASQILYCISAILIFLGCLVHLSRCVTFYL